MIRLVATDLDGTLLTPDQTVTPRTRHALEQRFVQLASHLAAFIQGYERTPESALAMLEFLEAHFAGNQAIAAAIRKLIAET
jgi:haloacid dehalogenase-like hydrolase